MGEFDRAIDRFEATLETPLSDWDRVIEPDRELDVPVSDRPRFDDERDVLETFHAALEPSDVVWDVNAKDGLYTLFAADRVGPDDVYAFHPPGRDDPSLVRTLNQVGFGSVGVVPALLVENSEVAQGRAPSSPIDARMAEGPVYPAAAVADFLAESPTVVHLDADGREAEILAGFSDEQFAAVRQWFVAVYQDGFGEWVRSLGFEVDTLAERSRAGPGWHSYLQLTETPDAAERTTGGGSGWLSVLRRGDASPGAAGEGERAAGTGGSDDTVPPDTAGTSSRGDGGGSDSGSTLGWMGRVLAREVGGAIEALLGHLIGRLIVLALIALLFVAFLLLLVALLPLTHLGISKQTLGAFAGAVVLLTPWVLFGKWWMDSRS